MSKRLTPFVFVILYICACSVAQDCDSGWFGSKCKFKCHCDPKASCDASTGQCSSPSKCALGWFGSACQYEDLVTDPTANIITWPSQSSFGWITDRDCKTCNTVGVLQRVNVTLLTPFPFTWLRITLNDSENLGRLTVSFQTTATMLNAKCVDQKNYVINNTIDIQCKVIVNTTSVIIEGHGVNSLCSLYISGGRNVALRQHATQTSMYTASGVNTSASNAVDGNTNSTFNGSSCTHTTDANPSWNVTFDYAQVLNRILVYNRNETTCPPLPQCGLRLNKFILESFNSTNTVFEYQDHSDKFSIVYSITVAENESIIPVNGLHISLSAPTVSSILTLCEVEAFGDCVSGSWGLECKSCNSTCKSQCDVENGACQVCNGYMNPPACDKPCVNGTWGFNCGNKCRSSCWQNSCLVVSGLCDKGCNGSQDFPNCTIDCNPGFSGPNCTKACSSNCFNSSCHRFTGLCNLGCNGSSDPPICNTVCSKGKWGHNCSNTCNTSCWEKSCNRFTGTCDEGCNGYKDFPNCNIECEHGNWGPNCTKFCNSSCFNSSCDRLNSSCINGCNGYSDPPQCTKQCDKVKWGRNCINTCNISCWKGSCKHDSGVCDEGCNGYKNFPNCTIACDHGSYGVNCTHNCSNCWDSSCSSSIGLCNKACNGSLNYPTCDTACHKGNWGRNCSNTCNTSCWEQSCNRFTGTCDVDCNGYKDFPNCSKECDSTKWGQNCSNTCSNNCWVNSCNHVSGVCDQGCNGYSNFPNCSKVCDKGKSGRNCSNTCSTSCWDSSCNHVSGVCDLGCNGYSDFPNCIKACGNGKWGRDCSNTCNINCWDNSCNHVSGVCDQGCNGYSDFPDCTKECDPGESGLNCTNRCDNCYNKSCSSQKGFCEIGCDGYSNPPSCNIPCYHGLWGLNCTQSCHENCFNTSCDKQNGTCDKGCDGYNDPPYCSKICTPDLWGINCSKICSENCWDRSCDHKRGQCNKGCNGYKNPPHCNEGCDSGTWSINCTASCSSQCFNTSCHSQTGECHQGCHAGYVPPNCEQGCDVGFYGINCSNHCSSNCSKSQCQPTLGHCLKCNDEHTGHFCEALIDAATPIGVIVGPIIAAIVVSVLILAGVVLWRRRRAFKRAKNNDGDVDDTNESKRISNTYQKILSVFQKKPKDTYNEDDTDSINPQGLYNNEGTYANLQNTSIAVKDLYSYMHSHNKDYFEEQFKNIPVPKNVTTEVGMSSLNKHKNRYKNICTYDHSRVHLEINTARNEGDYINASYIKGLKKHDQFIASQGPNNIILNDFVRMLWEQQVDKVVMLTNLIEEGAVKCEKYWPDEATKQFGEIHIKLSSTQTFSDYIIRVLELSKPNEPSRILTQFHFTSWPDKGVPSAPWGLVDFEQRVSAKPTSRPIVVHCSAGVGRTGTFIALSNVLKEAEETGRIDCFQTVMRLRQDRVLMIQTAEQYWFLHRAAQVAIVCIGKTVTSNDIVGRIKLLDERTTTGKTKLEEEFKAVCDVCNEFVEEPQEVEDSTVEDANVYNNIEEMTDRSKNRFINILPKQKYRPFLACENQNMGDYINAVFLPGFKKKDQQLLTQLPMPKTVLDFWRMIKQYRISLIVAFELDAIANDETFGQYLPAGVEKTLNCSPYIVKMNDIKSSSLCEEQKLTVEMEKQKSLLSLSSTDQASQTVMHLKCLFTDFEPVKLLRFIKQVRSYNELADGRILYTCRNGAKYSGLASVLSLLLDRMEHDSCLTVPLVVGTIKTIRPEVISTVDQYRVLYQVLQRYSDNSVQYESLWSVAGNGAILSTTKNPVFDETQDTDANIYANV